MTRAELLMRSEYFANASGLYAGAERLIYSALAELAAWHAARAAS